jgi:hypothetical protein
MWLILKLIRLACLRANFVLSQHAKEDLQKVLFGWEFFVGIAAPAKSRCDYTCMDTVGVDEQIQVMPILGRRISAQCKLKTGSSARKTGADAN